MLAAYLSNCIATVLLIERFFCLVGLDHFDDFRFFHFFPTEVFVDGVRETVGFFQCKATVLSKTWHDTRGDTSKVNLIYVVEYFCMHSIWSPFPSKLFPLFELQFIPLFKDVNQKLDFETFWNVPGTIPPFLVPAQDAHTLQQLQDSLDFCAPRIQRTRNPEVQHPCIASSPQVTPTCFLHYLRCLFSKTPTIQVG
jgi:hypothetical protein